MSTTGIDPVDFILRNVGGVAATMGLFIGIVFLALSFLFFYLILLLTVPLARKTGEEKATTKVLFVANLPMVGAWALPHHEGRLPLYRSNLINFFTWRSMRQSLS
jgi:hypothetical protein